MAPLVSITETLAVTPVKRVRGLQAFVSNHLWTPSGARGVFGGQVIAQSLMAACLTVKDKDLHSQHCYFLLPANSQMPITFTVERLRDGKSYATRLVHALQDNQTVFILMASFISPPIKLPDFAQEAKDIDQGSFDLMRYDDTAKDSKDDPTITESLKFDIPHDGDSTIPKVGRHPIPFSPQYRIKFPKDIMPWGSAIIEEEQWQSFLDAARAKGADLGKRAVAVQNYINERTQSPVSIAIARQQAGEWGSTRAIWLKPRLGNGEELDANSLRCFWGFMADFQFIGTAARSIGLSGKSKPRLGMMASLDHTTHYYALPDDFDPSAPLLHIMESVMVDVASGRGFVRGLLYTDKGVLVAATSQEGVVRADFGGGMRPRREKDRHDKAKL